VFRDQSGFIGGSRAAGPVGGCTKPLGPFGGSRAGSELLGPVGNGGEGSRIFTSPSVSVAVGGSSFTFPCEDGGGSFDIIVSITESAFAGVRGRLSM
jgi:hypothetical protein